MNDRASREFGRYRLVEELGSGGMAVVHHAIVDGPLGFVRDLVIKRIRPEFTDDVRFVEMLAAEARLCGRLRHPGIVQVHEFGEVDGEFYLAMELVEGETLSRLLQALRDSAQPAELGAIIHLVGELAHALAYAHALTDETGQSLGVVHRDVTPSNVMVMPNGGVKLLDFGIAKAASHLRDEQTRSGTLRGKLAYMSPEQAEGLAVDRRTDVFALGVIFWEALTLRRLFKGETDLETLRLIREANVPAPSAIVPGLDSEVETVVLRMLAANATARYASCDDVVTALQPFVFRHRADAAALRRLLAAAAPHIKRAPRRQAWKLRERRAGREPTLPTKVLNAEETVPSRSHLARRWLLVATALAVLMATESWLLWRRHARPPRNTIVAVVPTPPPARSTPAAAAATKVETVSLSVRGTSGAEVSVDGEPVGTVPLDIRLPVRGGQRRVEVRHAGAVPSVETVAADADATLDIVLRRNTARYRRAPAPSLPNGPRVRDPFAQ